MGTKMLRPRKNGCNLAKLPDQQLVFVNELAADLNFNGTEAARRAGYKQPSVAACRLLGLPKIQAALGKVLGQRIERCELKADDVLDYLATALFLAPLEYFTPAESGGWLIEDPKTLPDKVGRLIEDMELKVWEAKDGTRARMYKVRLFSKAIAAGLLAKHLNLSGTEEKRPVIDWEQLHGPRGNGQNAIEEKILDVASE